MKLAALILFAAVLGASAQEGCVPPLVLDPATGTCVKPCGLKGKPICATGTPCPGVAGSTVRLTDIDGICKTCGALNTPACPDAPACNKPMTSVDGVCIVCGGVDQAPCNGVCKGSSVIPIKNVCVICGFSGKPQCPGVPCPPSNTPIKGVCTKCGQPGLKPCPDQFLNNAGCAGLLKVVKGVCTRCGGVGQKPCA